MVTTAKKIGLGLLGGTRLPARLLEGFETIGQWTLSGTGAAMAADNWALQGSKSVKLTAASTPGAFAAATKTASWDISRKGVLVIGINAPGGDNMAPVLYFSSAAFAGSKWLTKTVGYFNALVRGPQMWAFDIDGMTVSGGESPGNIMNTLRVRLDSPAGIGSGMFDALYVNAKDRPRVVLSFDDGWATQYSEAYPYLASKGMLATFYIIKNLVGSANYCSLAQLQEMYAAGHDVGNHTEDHLPFNSKTVSAICASQTPTTGALTINGTLASGGEVVLAEPHHISVVQSVTENKSFTITGELSGVPKSETIGGLNGANVNATTGLFDKITGVTISANASGALTVGIARTEAEIQADIEAVRDYLITNEMPRAASHVAYPQGETNSSSDAAMAGAAMVTGRTTRSMSHVTYFGHLNPYNMPGRAGAIALASMKAYIDEAIVTGTTAHILMHKISGSTSGLETSVSDFQALVDYIAAKRDAGLLDVLTISQWHQAVSAGAKAFPA